MAGMTFKRAYWVTFILLAITVMLGASTVPLSDPLERIRTFTRKFEFDYVTWTLNSLGIKLGEIALGTANYLPLEEQPKTVLETLNLIQQINQVEAKLNEFYSDPDINNPDLISTDLNNQLTELKNRRAKLEPLAEAILQNQVNDVAARTQLAIGGQAFPPVLFHTTPPPDALIISPRDEIKQDHNISISPDITVDQIEKLEQEVDKALNVSSLVVGIGGIGLYPTMIMETTDINWLTEVVAHEWVHNYLTLRPLGVNYMNSPELRTMNETVAAIAGKELGRAVVEKYYPEYLPAEDAAADPAPTNDQPAQEDVFDFRAEMNKTRVDAERLLSEGKIDEAETYMELRRRFLWDNGYHIRKLNQAYFAFYGAYADQPGGAAGEDPVGAAVRLMRDQSPSLADFVNRMSWMWKFEQLQKAVGVRNAP
jgi:hypothetical protein